MGRTSHQKDSHNLSCDATHMGVTVTNHPVCNAAMKETMCRKQNCEPNHSGVCL